MRIADLHAIAQKCSLGKAIIAAGRVDR